MFVRYPCENLVRFASNCSAKVQGCFHNSFLKKKIWTPFRATAHRFTSPSLQEKVEKLSKESLKTINEATARSLNPFSASPKACKKEPLPLSEKKDLPAKASKKDWKADIREKTDALTQTISSYSVAFLLRKHCGFENDKAIDLFELVREYEKDKQNTSLWRVFSERFQLSFFQKITSFFFYCLYYKTPFITRTIETYLEAFIGKLSPEKLLDASVSGSEFFSHLLRFANACLLRDHNAYRNYSKYVNSDDLETNRNREVEESYGGDSKKLYEDFSWALILEETPSVRFFASSQKIFFIGAFFRALEHLINRFLIRDKVSQTLPLIFEGVIDTGLNKIGNEEGLFFANQLSFFLHQQVIEIQKLIDSEKSPVSKKEPFFLKKEQIQELVANLFTSLSLVPCKLRDEVEEAFNKRNKERNGSISIWSLTERVEHSVQREVEASIEQIAEVLLCYLKDALESGEFAAKALELAQQCLRSSSELSTDQLRAEYEKRQKAIYDTAAEAFRSLVRKTVRETISPPHEKRSQTEAMTKFSEIKEISLSTVTNIDPLIKNLRKAPLDLSSCKEMLDLSSCKEMLESCNSIQKVFSDCASRMEEIIESKDMSWIDGNIFSHKADSLIEEILTLQKTVQALEKSLSSLALSKEQSQNLTTLEKALEKQNWKEPLQKLLSEKRNSKEFSEKLKKLTEALKEREEFIIARDAYTYLTRTNEKQPKGLLDLWKEAKGELLKGFENEEQFIEDIEEIAKYFEEAHAKNLVDILKNKEPSFEEKLKAIEGQLQIIHQKLQEKQISEKHIKCSLQTLQDSINAPIEQVYSDIASIRQVLRKAKETIESSKLEIDTTLPHWVKEGTKAIFTQAAGMGVAAGLSLQNPLALGASAALSSSLARASIEYFFPNRKSSLLDKNICPEHTDVSISVAMAAGGVFSTNLLPTIGSLTGDLFGAKMIYKEGSKRVEQYLFDKVYQKFGNMLQFIQETIIPYKYLTKGAMAEYIKQNKKP